LSNEAGKSIWINSRPWARIALAVMLLAAGALPAQERVGLLRERLPQNRPELLVLGSGHFSNTGRDVINDKVDNVLTSRRQGEIAAVADQLAAFHPTRVAIEWPMKDQKALRRAL
jgi:hypothetical protein